MERTDTRELPRNSHESLSVCNETAADFETGESLRKWKHVNLFLQSNIQFSMAQSSRPFTEVLVAMFLKG